ncbi:MAG: hypothetical protein ACPKM0_05490 [Pleomorphochaeta sp.]
MRKKVLLFLIISLFIYPIFADEYSDIYDLVVPETYSTLSVNGGLWNAGGNSSLLEYDDNIIEISLVNGVFDFDVEADVDYEYLVQDETDFLFIDADANVRVGTNTNSVFTSFDVNYISYDLDISGFTGFWNVGGSGNATITTNSLSFEVAPAAAIGIGRVYLIYDVYRAKVMMEQLNVTPTPEKVEAVVHVMQKAQEIIWEYSEESTQLYKDYYQQLADAMGIPDRAFDVVLLNVFPSQDYLFNRARYIGMINGWDARLGVDVTYSKQTWGNNFNVEVGPEAQIGDFLMDDMLYFDAAAQVKYDYTLNGSSDFNVYTDARVVYLPNDYRWWAEAEVEVDYLHGNATQLQIDLAGAAYYQVNSNFIVYGGLRYDKSWGTHLFAGGEYRIW